MAYNTDEKRREAERQMQEELRGIHPYGDFIIVKQNSYGLFRIEHEDPEANVPKALLGLWTDVTTAREAINRVMETVTE